MSDLRSTELRENSEGHRVARCACGDLVLWTETMVGGRRMAVEAEPSREGNVAIEDRGMGRLIAYTFSGRNLESMRIRVDSGLATLYVAHDCPETRRG